MLAVDDDAVETPEQLAPEASPARGPARKQVVRREDRRDARPEDPRVELRCGKPLHVEDVRPSPEEARSAWQVLGRLEREPEARTAEEARAERIEELGPAVAVGARCRAEPEPRRDELHVDTGARERRRELVVVRRRERRWIGKDDAHT